MNQDLINDKDEIISVLCAACHVQTIYLKIINAAENTQLYRPQRIMCTQCQLSQQHNQTEDPPALVESA